MVESIRNAVTKLGGYVRHFYSRTRDLVGSVYQDRGMSPPLVYRQEQAQKSASYPSNAYVGMNSGHGSWEYGAIVSLGPGYPPRLQVGSRI